MFANLFKVYTFGMCMLMLFMQRSGWRPIAGSSPVPPGVRAVSRSYHSSLSSGSSGGFFHK